jgi:hypothetical protein
LVEVFMVHWGTVFPLRYTLASTVQSERFSFV